MTTGVFLFFFASILLGMSVVSSNMVSAFASPGSEKFSTAGGRVAIADNGRLPGGGGATGTAGGSAGKGTGSGSRNDPTKGSGTIPLIAGAGAAAGAAHPHHTGNAAPIAAGNPSATLAVSIFFIFLLIFRFFG